MEDELDDVGVNMPLRRASHDQAFHGAASSHPRRVSHDQLRVMRTANGHALITTSVPHQPSHNPRHSQHSLHRQETHVSDGREEREVHHVSRRGSIRILLNQTSKALGLPYEPSTPEQQPPTLNNRVFQFQRQTTNSSLNLPSGFNMALDTSRSVASSKTQRDQSLEQRCCETSVSRLLAHSILVMVVGAYVLMGTLLYVYIIGPEEAAFEAAKSNKPFDVEAVMEYLNTAILKQFPVRDTNVTLYYPNLDNFRSYLKHHVKAAGVYENKRDFSAVSGILYSVSIISGVGIGNPPRTWLGKVVTFPYCFFGVPLFALFLYVIGDDVSKLIAVMYHESLCCSMCRHRDKSLEARQFQAASGNDLKEGYRRIQACVPVSLMLVLTAFYVMLAVLIFGLWENWDTIQSIYFCVMVLFTVGLIDEIPGDHTDHRLTSMTSHIRRSLVIVYIICGWLLIAATFHAVASRIVMQKKKRQFKLTMQSRTASMIFRHNHPGATATSNHHNNV